MERKGVGKMNNAAQEMQRLGINILGLNEINNTKH